MKLCRAKPFSLRWERGLLSHLNCETEWKQKKPGLLCPCRCWCCCWCCCCCCRHRSWLCCCCCFRSRVSRRTAARRRTSLFHSLSLSLSLALAMGKRPIWRERERERESGWLAVAAADRIGNGARESEWARQRTDKIYTSEREERERKRKKEKEKGKERKRERKRKKDFFIVQQQQQQVDLIDGDDDDIVERKKERKKERKNVSFFGFFALSFFPSRLPRRRREKELHHSIFVRFSVVVCRLKATIERKKERSKGKTIGKKKERKRKKERETPETSNGKAGAEETSLLIAEGKNAFWLLLLLIFS